MQETPEYAWEMAALITGQNQLIKRYAMGQSPSVQSHREATRVKLTCYIYSTFNSNSIIQMMMQMLWVVLPLIVN